MPSYRFLDYELSEADFRLSRDGQRIALEPKALRVLTLLVSRAGRLVDKQELLDAVWPNTFVEENTLTRTIANLRRELGDSSRDSKLIETVPTRGYRFIATVEMVSADGSAPSLPGESGAQAIPSGTAAEPAPVSEAKLSVALPESALSERTEQERTGPERAGPERAGPATLTEIPAATIAKSRSIRFRLLLLAVCLSVAAIFSVWFWYRRMHAEGPIRSLAVLPLEDLSPGMHEGYFADGMTDELITELAHIQGLRVISRTSVLQDKGVHKPLRQIARELNVDAVVEGSVFRSGDRMRITAQLIDARSDKHLWAQTFEGPMGDVLTLQDSVAREIAQQTSTVLMPMTESAKGRHIDPAAHDAYLRGLYFVQRRDAELAVSYFRKAIAIEPDYAAASAGLSEALVAQILSQGDHAPELMPLAIAAAKHAIELDPSSGEAFTALGAIDVSYRFDWKDGEKNIRKGIELSPSSADAETWLAVYLISVGRPSEAVDAMHHAVELDPYSFWANRLLGSALYYARRYDESLAALKRASELAPDKYEFVEGWNSDVYEMQGRYSDALESDLRDIASQLSPQDVDSFRSAFKSGGWKGYQEARIRYLLPRADKRCYMNPISMSYLRLGNLDEVFRWLNRDVDKHCGRAVFDASSDPRLDSIRGDARFGALLQRLNLPH